MNEKSFSQRIDVDEEACKHKSPRTVRCYWSPEGWRALEDVGTGDTLLVPLGRGRVMLGENCED